MVIGECIKCDKTLYTGDVARHFPHTDVFVCHECNNLDQPERSKREDSYNHAEFGCTVPVRFVTEEGFKTILPGKRYDENLNEIRDAVL